MASIDDLVMALVDADVAYDTAKKARDEAEAALADAMDKAKVKEHDTAIGTFERKATKVRRAWRHDDLVRQVVARAADNPENLFDPETGGTLPPAVIAERIARELRATIGFGPGKVTGLKARGIDPDEFCEADGWRVSIRRPPMGKPEDVGDAA